jgi:hypothetical protein
MAEMNSAAELKAELRWHALPPPCMEVELCWPPAAEPCVGAGPHHWHLHIVASIPMQPELWLRRCAWCGRAEPLEALVARDEAGPFSVSNYPQV